MPRSSQTSQFSGPFPVKTITLPLAHEPARAVCVMTLAVCVMTLAVYVEEIYDYTITETVPIFK